MLILQHPLEVSQTKGSARLLHMSLVGSQLKVGEAFAPEPLQNWLHAGGKQPVLLYPAAPELPNRAAISDALPADTVTHPAASPTPYSAAHAIACANPAATGAALTPFASVSGAASNIRLVVLDGTWRKSRKMLYANPQLALLPRYSLSSMPASHYRVRKAHRPDQLSTLEAVCYALGQLEGDSAKYAPLLAAFDGFVAQLARYWEQES